jgi:hypothetical protein
MALFLTESYNQSLPVVSLEEAMSGLLEANMALASLNESVLQADFILHEKHQQMVASQGGLNESVQALIEEEQQGFFTRVWSKVKAGLTAAKDKIIQVFVAVPGKFKELWTKITTKKAAPAEGDAKPGSIKVNVHKYKLAEAALAGLVVVQKAIEDHAKGMFAAVPVAGSALDNWQPKADAALKTFDTEFKAAVKKFNDDIEAGSKEQDKIGGVMELLPVNGVSAIGDGANKIGATAQAAKTNLEAAQKHAEDAAKAANDAHQAHDATKKANKDNLDASKQKSKADLKGDHSAAQASIKNFKSLISAYSTLAGLATKVFGMSTAAVHV